MQTKAKWDYMRLVSCIAFCMCVLAAAQTSSRLNLIHSDVLYKDERMAEADVLIGNVELSHEGAILVCDSGLYYKADNSFDAYHNVVMTQGDTLRLVCDSLFYDGYEMRALARGIVTLYHNNTRLETENLDYDRVFGIGNYEDGGTLYDGDNVLVSRWGQYKPAAHEAFFTDNVNLNNPSFKLVSDTLYYYTDTKIAKIVSPTSITSQDGTFVYGLKGDYDTNTSHATLLNRSYVIKDMRRIEADSLVYDKESQIDEAFGHVVIDDDENLCKLTGNYCRYYEASGNAFATDSAVAYEYSSGDTLFVHGDTLKLFTYNMGTDSVHRDIVAYHHVRMYRFDVQAVCDSLVSIELDSCTYLYGQPILWQENQQIFGEEIRVYNNDSTIDWIHIINQAMTIECVDSNSYNQVSSKEMFSYFADGQLERNEAHGNVFVVYFMDEDDGSRIGMSYAESTDLKMYLNAKKIDKIWMPASSVAMYPEMKIPSARRYLSGFAWFDYIRPKDKDDIFLWRSKDAKNMLIKTEQRVVPLQSLDDIQ